MLTFSLSMHHLLARKQWRKSFRARDFLSHYSSVTGRFILFTTSCYTYLCAKKLGRDIPYSIMNRNFVGPGANNVQIDHTDTVIRDYERSVRRILGFLCKNIYNVPIFQITWGLCPLPPPACVTSNSKLSKLPLERMLLTYNTSVKQNMMILIL
jgi:hypothetical protein